MSGSTQWGWDLVKHQPVRWDERGPGDQVMGPYPSREAAENWQEQVQARNERWDEDTAWNDEPDDT